EATRAGLPEMAKHFAGELTQLAWQATKLHLVEFVTLFYQAFAGRALPEPRVGATLLGFARLPEAGLGRAAAKLKLSLTEAACAAWKGWLDEENAQKALLSAIYTAEWAYVDDRRQKDWFYASPIGLAMLDLGPAPRAEPLPTDLAVQPPLSVSAG